MIVRTHPAKRKAGAYTVVTPGSAATGQQLVVYEDPSPDSHDGQPEPMLCTYQCRQMIMMDDRLQHDGIPVTMFTLQSIYAQTEDEKLEFEYESGNTTIVTNGYTLQPDISQQVETFIKRCNSIPAFTANLTIESFNRRTLS